MPNQETIFSELARAVQANLEAYKRQDAIDETHRPIAEKWDELDEFGNYDEGGGTLSRADFEDVRGM